jgi:predicted MPP superfamily phosphohydrolase
MTNDFTILHLSDLHFEPDRSRDISIVKQALLWDIRNLSEKHGISPDIVAFSGDLIQAGDFGYSHDRNDYETVEEQFIKPLLENLSLTAKKLFICPGNHDIQRNIVDRDVYMEAGLKDQLSNRDSVNELVDKYEDSPGVFARMGNYSKFWLPITFGS